MPYEALRCRDARWEDPPRVITLGSSGQPLSGLVMRRMAMIAFKSWPSQTPQRDFENTSKPDTSVRTNVAAFAQNAGRHGSSRDKLPRASATVGDGSYEVVSLSVCNYARQRRPLHQCSEMQFTFSPPSS